MEGDLAATAVHCEGCWCPAGSQGIWRGVDQHLHPAVRFPPKKRLEMAIGTEKALGA